MLRQILVGGFYPSADPLTYAATIYSTSTDTLLFQPKYELNVVLSDNYMRHTTKCRAQ